MAEKNSFVEDYQTCLLCLETFRNPVSLSCSHSFCQRCLQNCWANTPTRKCPVCKRKSSEDNTIKFSLKELAYLFTERQSKVYTCSYRYGHVDTFCKDEGQMFCRVCEGLQHSLHSVVTVEEAARELKDELEIQLQSLTKSTENYKQLERTYKEMVQHSEKQAFDSKWEIKYLFMRLQSFLKDEEERAMDELRKEQQRVSQKLSSELYNIRQKLSSLSKNIQDLEEHLHRDTQDFLTHYSQAQSFFHSPENPKPRSGLLINQAKVVGNLGFRVWKKMVSKSQYRPVILDPNTAGRSVCLSEDLSSFKDGPTQCDVPDNPERFTEYTSVLGSEGFTTGRHQWDVEVGDYPKWTLAVVQESVNRKGSMYLSPRCGLWSLLKRSGKYTNGCGQVVPVRTQPQKIRVLLDYEAGQVSFYDADNMIHLYTHKDTFTEKLFPYFNIGINTGDKTSEIKICVSEPPQLGWGF